MNEKRKQHGLLILPFLVLMLGMVFTSLLFLRTYRRIAFEHISVFCETVLESAPEAETRLLSALKDYNALTEQEITGNNYLDKYGYRADEFCKGLPLPMILFPLIVFLLAACAFAFVFFIFRRKNQKRITDLTAYLERVNTGSGGTLIQTTEDDFSHLQDEIYKTVTALYQTKEAAVSAKMNFADNLANIAHQLKTPITAACLSLQLMKNRNDNEYAGQIEEQLERLTRLEESLLTLSSIDAGTLPIKQEKVDLYTVLNLAAENLNELLLKKNVSVEIPDKGCVEVSGDLEWTMEAFINLMKDCMEYSPSGGCVHCDYTENPLYAEILIWDEGTGFAAEDIPHLFERFYRGKHSAPGGIGIGLSLAKAIIALQNGTVTARNLNKGGACFEIRFYRH